MKIINTPLVGMKIIEPDVYTDSRGFFKELFSQKRYSEVLGDQIKFVQDNLSHSKKNVLRGLHYQLHHPQGKLVTVIQGEVFDVGVDLRQSSKTFGKWYGTMLSEKNHRQFYVPEGFAHGFYVLSDEVDFCYKCTDYYHKEDDLGVFWNDSTLAIDWSLIAKPILSDKDIKLPKFADITKDKLPR